MRFLRTRTAPVSRVLLVESGSRHLLEDAIPKLHKLLGESTPFDLLTCYAGLPAGLTAESGPPRSLCSTSTAAARAGGACTGSFARAGLKFSS